ncbi:MAG: hypothetical protein EU535_08040 [Promethearchaeota archaeon]|nr:MAG: hypothetical protein EU535_08040 [Candidatus Lokiarchaeota archaeon]
MDNVDMRYTVLFLYIIRNDLLRDLNDDDLVASYERVLALDDIYKSNVLEFWDEHLIETAIDLGLFKNIRSIREFELKEDDFILKMGEETITIEQGTILVPDDTLFAMIQKRFKLINRRNFNTALIQLKAVRCEVAGVIHPFIFQLGENDITLAEDLYYILDQYGNIFQAIKMEITIEGFYKRFQETYDKITEYIDLFDPVLSNKSTLSKIKKAMEEGKSIIPYLKEEKVKLSDKFDNDSVDKNAEIYQKWNETLLRLIQLRYQTGRIDDKLLEIKKYYSGKDKIYSYLQFIEKVSFNEDEIVDKIQQKLRALRKEIIDIDEEIGEYTKKDMKLLNLDYERFLLLSGDGEDEE